MSRGTLAFRDMGEIKAANRAAGFYFFSPDALRFFRSRVSETVYGGRFFVTSEAFDERAPRLFTVRVAHPDGTVQTVGEFQQYASRRAAHNAAQRLAAVYLETGECPCGNHEV